MHRTSTKFPAVLRWGLLNFFPEKNTKVIGIVEPQPVGDLFDRKGRGSKKVFCFLHDAVVDGLLCGQPRQLLRKKIKVIGMYLDRVCIKGNGSVLRKIFV